MFSRRKFLKLLGIISGSVIAFPSRLLYAKPLSINLEKVNDLKEVGGIKTLKIKKKPILFFRDSETTIRAFDLTCTHKGCETVYNKETKRIECPCHKSAFDLEGNVLGGPC